MKMHYGWQFMPCANWTRKRTQKHHVICAVTILRQAGTESHARCVRQALWRQTRKMGAISQGNKDGTVVEHREIGVRDHPHRTAHRQMKNNQTLCWDCKNAIGGGCSWFTDFTPVAGWKAKKERLYSGCSYTVEDCPQFEDGRAQ